MTVLDASVIVAATTDPGPCGRWAEAVIGRGDLVAPDLVLVEVANVLRRLELSSRIAGDLATAAHRDVLDLHIELVSYPLLAARVWTLRHNVSAYDACYVALAESLDAPLATLDRRLANAVGPRCAFELPTP